ncbi:MAG: SDR family oxidoreductase [Saprospiraceae bacterium]
MNEFKGNTVWITGGSSGLGEAMAKAFAAHQTTLILSGRNEQALHDVKHSCELLGAKVFIVVMDMNKPEEIFNIASQVTQLSGPVDILVNNAGISQRSVAAHTAFAVDQMIIRVNLLATIALTKALLPAMLLRKSGKIVVISSLVGKFATPLRSAYAASKHGLHGFFDALRAETYDQGIKVTLICPGFIHTNISVNALINDGEKQNKMDDAQANGMEPAVFARKVLSAVARGKRESYIGGREILGIYISRWFPGIFARMMRTQKVT